MNLRVDRVRLATGVEIDEFHVLEYPDWACIVCRTENDGIVMVEQYRHGLGKIIRELPAGSISPAEPALETARRELLEETGFAAENWRFLGKFATEPSRHTSWAHFFFADGARKVSEPSLDSGEDIQAVVIPLAALGEQLEEGTLVHGVQLSAILLAERQGLLD